MDDDDDEDDVEWEEGAEEIIDRKSTFDTSEREIESHQRLRHIWEWVLLPEFFHYLQSLIGCEI